MRYRGQSGSDGGLQVLDDVLQQARAQGQLVSVHRDLQAAGELLPGPGELASLQGGHAPRVPHPPGVQAALRGHLQEQDRKSTRLNSSH